MQGKHTCTDHSYSTVYLLTNQTLPGGYWRKQFWAYNIFLRSLALVLVHHACLIVVQMILFLRPNMSVPAFTVMVLWAVEERFIRVMRQGLQNYPNMTNTKHIFQIIFVYFSCSPNINIENNSEIARCIFIHFVSMKPVQADHKCSSIAGLFFVQSHNLSSMFLPRRAPMSSAKLGCVIQIWTTKKTDDTLQDSNFYRTLTNSDCNIL